VSTAQGPAADSVPASISQNIETIAEYYKREAQRIGRAQRLLERIGAGIGQPGFLGAILIFVALWIGGNLLALHLHLHLQPIDPPPFSALQGIVSLAALVTTTIVLIGQNRLAKQEQRREQLELQVNILTEQKTTKLIHLLEELRHDLPMVRDREDPDAAALQQPTDTAQILNALEQAQDSVLLNKS
jgi:uncharacterized membrane protein